MKRREFLAASTVVLAAPFVARAEEAPGVSGTELKIGNTNAYTGPVAQASGIAKAEAAFFKLLNAEGGIGGRRINFISLDDSYSAPKTVEATRHLIEEERVAFMFNSLGTAPQAAVREYLNERKVPQLFIFTGADKFANPQEFPWTMTLMPSYRTNARIYARYILDQRPDAKIAILYQNDDIGKDYLAGVKDVVGDRYDKLVVKTVAHAVTDPTLQPQIEELRASGANVLITAGAGNVINPVIQQIYDTGWKPLHCVNYASAPSFASLRPIGADKAVGLMDADWTWDPADPAAKSDPALEEWRRSARKAMPDVDPADNGDYVQAYVHCVALLQVLNQCGNDLSRQNIVRQAANLHDLSIPGMFPGIKINTSPTNYRAVRQMQMTRFNGKGWDFVGGLIKS